MKEEASFVELLLNMVNEPQICMLIVRVKYTARPWFYSVFHVVQTHLEISPSPKS